MMEQKCIEFDDFARMMTGEPGDARRSGLERLGRSHAFLSASSLGALGSSFWLQVGLSLPVRMLLRPEGAGLYVYFGDFVEVNHVAAYIRKSGKVNLRKYANNRPTDYPRTGSVLSSGTSTMNFLKALAVLMGVQTLQLTDISHVPGCLLPLAFARIAVGRPTWYESLGFTIESRYGQSFRRSLGKYLQSQPVLVEACQLMFNERFTPRPDLYEAVNYLSEQFVFKYLAERFGGIEYSMPNPGLSFLTAWRAGYGIANEVNME